MDERKTLKDILEGGGQWQKDLSIIIIDLCMRVDKLEKNV
jgi:hypothetical protein